MARINSAKYCFSKIAKLSTNKIYLLGYSAGAPEAPDPLRKPTFE